MEAKPSFPLLAAFDLPDVGEERIEQIIPVVQKKLAALAVQSFVYVPSVAGVIVLKFFICCSNAAFLTK